MARTYIGVDVDQSRLHIVCLEQGADGLFVRAIANREIDGIDRAVDVVEEIVQECGVSTTRIGAALPSDRLLSRMVTFPFADPRKIAAAVPLELAAQLPVDLDGYHITSIPAGRDGDQFRSFALAVPDAEVAQFLAPFDRQQLPLRVLEVSPFTDIHLLSKETPDAILVTIREAGYTVARAEARTIQAYRHGLISDSLSDADLAAAIMRDVHILSNQVQDECLPVFLSGSGLSVARQRALIDRLPGSTVPEVQFESGRLQAAYLPALALARRAAVAERKAGFNLRFGRHAFSGSLAPFRQQLIVISVLMVLAMVAVASGFWFDYAVKAQGIERLDQSLKSIYRQSFPHSPVPADVPMYLTSHLAGLHEQSRLLGVARTGPLQVLESITKGAIADNGIEVQEFNFDVEGAALYGRAGSFDAVDQLAARLRLQPIFAQVLIGDAKMSVDGSRVDFRIDFEFSSGGAQP
jgi:general secretion pathway protein L